MTTLLPLPVVRAAACAGHSEPLWDDYLDHPEPAEDRAERHRKAQQVCARCPSREECLAGRGERDRGVWGGLVFTGSHPEEVATPVERRCVTCQVLTIPEKAWFRRPELRGRFARYGAHGRCSRCHQRWKGRRSA